jgi:type I restriction enzyme S subunit
MKSEFLIKNLGKVITGNTPSKLNREFYDSNDIHFIKPDLISYSTITKIYNSNEYLSEKARYKARIVPKHTVLVTCIGNIGKVGYVTLDEVAFNQQINAIITNDLVLPRYLAYALIANQKQLEAIANAPVVPLINKTQFENFSLSIHNDIEEQAKVINILDKLSNIIELKKVELNEYDQLIKSRFVEMFGDIFNGKSNYPTVKISEVVIPKIERAKKDFNSDDEIKYVDISSVDNEKNIMIGYSDYLMKDAPSRAQQHVRKNDIVISKVRPNLNNVAKVSDDYSNIVASSGFCVLRVSMVEPNFLFALVSMQSFADYLASLTTGANYPAVSDKDILNFEIPNAPFEEQTKFSDFIKQVDKLKFEVQKSLDESQMLFDSLMQEYFG